MVDELSRLIDTFPGQANLTRCFNHILSLTAKTVVRQFDVKKGKENEALDDAERALQELAAGSDVEDLEMQLDELRRQLAEEDDIRDDLEDDPDDWLDERDLLPQIEREKLDENIRPIKLVLVKVRIIVHADTIQLTNPRMILVTKNSICLDPFLNDTPSEMARYA